MSGSEKSRIWLTLRAIELVIFSLLFSIVFYFFMNGKALLNENLVGHGVGYYIMAIGGFYVVFLYGPISFTIWWIFFNGTKGRAAILNAAPFIALYGAFVATMIYASRLLNDSELKAAALATAVSFLILAAVNIIAPILLMKNVVKR